MFRPVSLLLLFALFIAQVASAQVQISDVDRSFQNGVTVEISGSGFGTKDVAAPWVWDDLTHTSYAGLRDGDPIPTRDGGASDALYKDSSGSVVYDMNHEQQRVPGRAVYSCVGDYGVITEIGRPHGNQEFLYLDYWFYSTSVISVEPGANYIKIHRVWPTPSSNLYGHASVYPGRVAYEPGPTNDDGVSAYGPIYPQEGRWYHIAAWYDSSGDMSAGDSHGIIKYWTDNVQVINVTNNGYRNAPIPADVTGFTHVETLGVESGNGPGHAGYTNLWGDIYIDSSQARVALGDADSWSQVRHYELQIPSSWSPDAIQVRSNLGSFDGTSPVWLYVVDPNGNVNSQGLRVDVTVDNLDLPGQPGKPAFVES